MSEYFQQYDNKTECTLCPHFCKLSEGKTGICGVRRNNGGRINLFTYGLVSGYSLDPVEKKPLYHFYPGCNIFSIGSFGCNMRCDFCQNYHISQSVPDIVTGKKEPGEILDSARRAINNIGIAFTYNEPSISFEFMRDVAIPAKKEGMKTVMVSNGYVNKEPLAEMISFIDAFNIDLKSFNPVSHKQLTGAKLEPVKESLKQIARAGRHLEITSLIIPGHNDREEEMQSQVGWIATELGKDIPFHLSRYFPMYRRNDPATSQDILNRLYEIASEKLDFVYVGNIHSDKGSDTRCPDCGTLVTSRSGYNTKTFNLDKSGNCSKCGRSIYRDFTFSRD